MKIHNIFADKVHLLGRAVRVEQGLKIEASFGAIRLEGCQIADRSIEPNIKILAWRVRNFDPKIGRIARDIPIAQVGFLVAVAEPLACFG